MITRTTIFAQVKGTRMYKEDGKVKSDTFEVAIPKCDTREKADKELEKIFKGELVSADEITFRYETRQMSDEDFERLSTIKEEGTLDEATLLAKSEHRKRK